MPLASVRLLHSILDKLLRADQSADGDKYRRIKLSVPKVQQCIVQVDGALQLLEAAGFQQQIVTSPVRAEDGVSAAAAAGAGISDSEAAAAAVVSPTVLAAQFLVFPREASIALVQLARQLLSPVLLAATTAAAATEAAATAGVAAATETASTPAVAQTSQA